MPAHWEVTSDEQALLALSGTATDAEYRADRIARASELRSTLAFRPSFRLFEIGSGDGIVARLLAGGCAALDCCDISESFIERARRTCQGLPHVRFHQITSRGLDPLPAASYDAGYSLNVFIHFNPYQIAAYLRDVRRLLKPGGLFYFDACTVGPQTLELFRKHQALHDANASSLPGLLNFNHPEVIRRIAEDAGLTVDGRSTSTTDGWLKVLVRRHT